MGNEINHLANNVSTIVSFQWAFGFSVMALMVIYMPICIGICSVLSKFYPKITYKGIYSYGLAGILGLGGVTFMVYAVKFFSL